jgi:hypothetical protein
MAMPSIVQEIASFFLPHNQHALEAAVGLKR